MNPTQKRTGFSSKNLFRGIVVFLFIFTVSVLVFPEKMDAGTGGATFSVTNGRMYVDGWYQANGNAIAPAAGTTRTIVVNGRYIQSGGQATLWRGRAYRSGVGSACAVNNLDCYADSCSGGSLNASIGWYSCSFPIQYYADTTTAITNPSIDYTSQNWQIRITVGQLLGNQSSLVTNFFELSDLASLQTLSSFNLGAFVPGSGNPTAETTTSVLNRGNVRIDPRIRTLNDFSCPNSTTIDAESLRYRFDSGEYSSKFPINATWRTASAMDIDKDGISAGVGLLYWQFFTSDPIPYGTCQLQSIELSAIAG